MDEDVGHRRPHALLGEICITFTFSDAIWRYKVVTKVKIILHGRSIAWEFWLTMQDEHIQGQSYTTYVTGKTRTKYASIEA